MVEEGCHKVRLPEIKRYTYRLLGTMSTYILTLVGVNLWFRYDPPHGLLAYVAAILPALPIAGVFIVIGRLLLEMRDEYLRMLMVRQSLFATAFALSIMTACSFLEGFGLIGHVPGHLAMSLWFVGLGLGSCANGLHLWRMRR